MKTSAKIITLLGLSTFSSARTLTQFSQQTIVDQGNEFAQKTLEEYVDQIASYVSSYIENYTSADDQQQPDLLAEVGQYETADYAD
jgi:pyocin large subunit-like protein